MVTHEVSADQPRIVCQAFGPCGRSRVQENARRLQSTRGERHDFGAQAYRIAAPGAYHTGNFSGCRFQPQDLALVEQLCSVKRHSGFQAYSTAVVLAAPVAQITLTTRTAGNKL